MDPSELTNTLIERAKQAARFMMLRAGKPFDFFLCHCKAASGSFVRLLKMYLTGAYGLKRRATKGVFLDSDNLKSLTDLFDYAATQTKTMVVVCTPDILTRKWCVGEVVTAMINKVPTVQVIFPGYMQPDTAFILGYQSFVPDLSCLSEHGISLDMIQRMMPWLNSCSSFNVVAISDRTMNVLCDELVNGPPNDGNLDLKYLEDALPKQPTCIIHVDNSSLEAVGTASILACMLSPLVAHSPEHIPFVLQQPSSAFPSTVRLMLIMCTNGAFQQKEFLLTLIAAAKAEVLFVPILAEETFRFPTRDFLKSIKGTITAITDEPDVLNDLIISVFKSIAVVFQPEQYSSTEDVLDAKANEIKDRMLKKDILQKLVLGNNPTSPDDLKSPDNLKQDQEPFQEESI